MRGSKRVQQALDAGASPVADGLAAVHWFRFQPRPDGGRYHVVNVDAGNRHVEVTISPTGRSVHVYVDGQRVAP